MKLQKLWSSGKVGLIALSSAMYINFNERHYSIQLNLTNLKQ